MLPTGRSAGRRPLAWCALGALALVLVCPRAGHAQSTQPLAFFKNYFVTGDYAVRGVSLWRKGVDGTAVAQIPALGGTAGVPPTADILAAFLYIQTGEKIQGSGIHHARFNGYDFGPFADPVTGEPGGGSVAKALTPWDQSPSACWSVAYPGGRKIVTYRADVLRFLPIDATTGKQRLDTSFLVSVPDMGSAYGDHDESSEEKADQNGPRAIGASLVVVYRDRAAPLRGIVLYDGAHTKRAYQTMTQRLEGFYQASGGAGSASMAHIVGDGRWYLSELVYVNGAHTATNPFRSAQGPKWDNWRAPVALPANASSVNIEVRPHGWASDCLSWSAMVLSTKVRDTDDDGLLDIWESGSGLVDPLGRALPNLAAMGADPGVKDLFVEIGYMSIGADSGGNWPTYGGIAKPPHSHLPSLEALQKVAEAFRKKGVNVHFDVGNNYQGTPLPYIVPAALARGGEAIDERVTVCDRDPNDPSVCQFRDYPGTVGWKSGFRLLKDQLIAGGPNGEPVPPLTASGDDPCDAPGSTCVRRFDAVRKDMFHYALFAHALGMPKDPCFEKDQAGNLVLDAFGNPKTDLSCPGNDPTSGFFVPRTNSGIADFPGGDLLVTLGAFDDSNGLPVGTPYMQAATLMHELGHNFELTHAGPPVIPREPNCKPNYLSVMNYLFQLRGLLDAGGVPQLDFSDTVLGPIDETGLMDGTFPFDSALYRTGWYAPRETSYLKNFAPAASKHCDGSDLLKDAQGTLTEPPMVRVDSLALASAGIDWNADGFLGAGGLPPAPGQPPSGKQDVNFNGQTFSLNAGANDWSAIRLNELAGRRSVGGFFTHDGRFFIGPLSLDIGRGDIGRGDIGRGDIGRGDIGRGDIGRGDIGRGDIGRGDIGRGDIGRGDIGRGDIGRGDIGRGDFGGGDMDVGAPNEIFNGEIDFETFVAVTGGQAPTPPSALQACLTDGRGQCASAGGDAPVRLSWLPPNVGRPVSYSVYRFDVREGAPFPPPTLPTAPLATVPAFLPPIEGQGSSFPNTTFLDTTAAHGAAYAYFVVAQFAPGPGEQTPLQSGISNFAVVATPSLGETGIENVQLASSTLTIGGEAVPYTAALTNATGEPLSVVVLQGWIQQSQSDARRAAGGLQATCGAGTGTLPPGRCVLQFTVSASNAAAGHGTLVAGSAQAVFELLHRVDGGQTLLDTFVVPITLAAPSLPAGSGSITDPAGDASAPATGETGPDLTSGAVLVRGDTVTLQVRFAERTFSAQTSVAQFSLDTDQNVNTGHRGSDAGCSADHDVLGTDYIIDFGAARGSQAEVRAFVGPSCNTFGPGTTTAVGSVVYVADGMDVTFPRSLIGNDDGALNFKVVTYVQGSGVLDRMTDAGLPPGSTSPE